MFSAPNYSIKWPKQIESISYVQLTGNFTFIFGGKISMRHTTQALFSTVHTSIPHFQFALFPLGESLFNNFFVLSINHHRKYLFTLSKKHLKHGKTCASTFPLSHLQVKTVSLFINIGVNIKGKKKPFSLTSPLISIFH